MEEMQELRRHIQGQGSTHLQAEHHAGKWIRGSGNFPVRLVVRLHQNTIACEKVKSIAREQHNTDTVVKLA